jgi:hypothetical protein
VTGLVARDRKGGQNPREQEHQSTSQNESDAASRTADGIGEEE